VGGLDGGDVDLFHPHHRLERPMGDSGIGIGDRFCRAANDWGLA
jgi:hypothetical protein